MHRCYGNLLWMVCLTLRNNRKRLPKRHSYDPMLVNLRVLSTAMGETNGPPPMVTLTSLTTLPSPSRMGTVRHRTHPLLGGRPCPWKKSCRILLGSERIRGSRRCLVNNRLLSTVGAPAMGCGGRVSREGALPPRLFRVQFAMRSKARLPCCLVRTQSILKIREPPHLVSVVVTAEYRNR